MNYNSSWWFFLCRLFVMVPICNFCPRKVLTTTCFWCLTDLVIILRYMFFTMESPRITVVGAFSFEDVDFLTMTCDWTRSWSWGWSTERLIKSSCSSCSFSFSSISFSSSIIKRLRDAKLLRSLLSDVLEFAVFLVWRVFQFDYYRYCFCFGNIRCFVLNFWWLA